ncbi:hypothetical protein NP233_g5431 [Leucocoprinus birnbaumii]|uniref:Uncharacterized protein n=1 Tax=Leucocoprinus birnbaumii TaxID=56174 RepID=A0AAD5YRW9_9AGAR|nr:hypothetical protein NP233_g5431 [Leucocoprinus birnbaumii]
MPIPIQPAPALLVGLGARILLDFCNQTEPPSVKNHILIGVWQGVAFHYATKNSSLGFLIIFIIAGKLIFEFNIYPDVNKVASTIIGVLLGFLGTDLINQFVESSSVYGYPVPSNSERRRRKVSFSTPGSREDKKRQRLAAQARANAQGGNEHNHYPRYHPVSDITSIDSNSDLIRATESMTPLEREVAALRARASLADSERRRYREERKWAISEGNLDRAAELKQQVKRYTALMQGFHREADAKMIMGVQNGQASTSGIAADGQRASTVPPQESQPRVRKSSLTNGHNNPPASPTWNSRPGPSRRVVVTTGPAAPTPILIRRDPTR